MEPGAVEVPVAAVEAVVKIRQSAYFQLETGQGQSS